MLWLGTLFLLYGLSYHGFTGSVIDEAMPLGVTAQLVTNHTLQINDVYPALSAWGAPNSDPTTPIYSKYALGQSLLMLPAYVVGSLLPIHNLTHAPDGQLFLPAVPVLMAYTLGSILTVLTVYGVICSVRTLGYDAKTGAWVGLLYGVTTFAWPYAKTLYNEPSTACALIGAIYWSVRYRQKQQPSAGLLMGLCLGMAILFRTSSVLYVPMALLYVWPANRQAVKAIIGRWLLPSLGIGLGILVTALYDWYRFGSVFETGYEPGFGRAPWEALLGYVVSPSRSLVLFAPILLLAIPGAVILRRKLPRETFYLSGLALIPVALYSTWWAWDGGASLGPRFLLPSVPVAIVLVAPLLTIHSWKPVLIALGIAGFLMQVLSNLPTTADVFGMLSGGSTDLSVINWQWARSLLANFWTVYTQRQIDSVLMRLLPLHHPVIIALIFFGLSALLVGLMIQAIRRLPLSTADDEQANLRSG